jgi:hypothetical protein
MTSTKVLESSRIGPLSNGFGCALCAAVFGTLTGFDAHQVRDYDATPPITCRDPAEMGYVLDAKGIWRTPEGRANRDRLAARLARLSARRQANRDGPVRMGEPAEVETVIMDPPTVPAVELPAESEVRRLLGL